MADAEANIKEIVEIHGGYANFVNVGSDLFEDSRNMDRMTRYRPISAHRLAFEKMARSLNPKDKRCYLLTGPYGSGKSHLCLMFANYLQTPAGEAPMPKFFEHYAKENAHAAEELKAKRMKGRYLVALCDWGSKDDFEEVVLRAVDQALKREGLEDKLETPYKLALKKIEEWKNLADGGGTDRGRFYKLFEQQLKDRNPELTVAKFEKNLGSFDAEALAEFKTIHQDITTARFTFDLSDLVAILTHTLASEAFKERFLGLLVLFDEFGEALEGSRINPKRFQRFAELAAETPSNCARLIFVGTAHKNLTDYAKAYNSTDFKTASDRIDQVPLGKEGIEDMIAAIVSPQKEKQLWQEEVAPRSNVFDKMLPDCQRMKLFEGMGAPKIRQAIIENIYPMHPVATHALIQLAQDVASNNRSVYTFFGGGVGENADPGSYGHFIASTPILSGKKLNLYTADMLYDYFAATLKSDNKELRETIREYIKDYESSLRELRRVAELDNTSKIQFQDELVTRILKLMLIYDIVQIPNTVFNLQFGLNYSTLVGEQAEVDNRLKELAQKGVLFHAKETRVYEFKKSTAVDLDRLVEEYKQNPVNLPVNIVAELNALVPLDRKNEEYLEAKDYNLTYGEDKRLLRRLVRAVELSGELETPQGRKPYFEALEGEIAQEITKRGDYEGLALYVVCETADEIQKARNFCAKNESKRIVIAIPKQPIPMLDAVIELRAIQWIEQSEEAKNFNTQDNAALNARLNGDRNHLGAKDALLGQRNKLLSSKEVTWYGQYAWPVPTEDTKPYDVANRVMEQLYADDRNKLAHDEFNKLHIKVDRAKNVALKEAVEEILAYTEPMIIDTSFAQNRGDRKYLEKCFLQNGVLNQVSKADTKLRCEFEKDPEKYASKLPTLAEMVREIGGLKSEQKVRIVDWIANYRRPPYGQGPISLALSLACLIRLFGDSIRIKQDEQVVGDMRVTSLENVLDLIEGQYANAFLSYRQLRGDEKALVKVVYETFGEPASAEARDYSLVETQSALKEWWKKLPPIAHVVQLYPRRKYPNTADFLSAMQKIDAKDAHTFLLDELPTAFGFDAGMMVTKETVEALKKYLPDEKKTLEAALNTVEESIMTEVRAIFQVAGNTYSDMVEVIRNWYNGLDNNQRDAYASWQQNDSKPLVIYLKSIDKPQDTFLVQIPKSPEYGGKAVQDWMADQVTDYVGRLRSGKARIDDNRLKVEGAKVTIEGQYKQEDGGPIMFKDSVRLTFGHTNPNVKIYVAEGSIDPTSPDADREQVNGTDPLVIEDNKTIKVAVQDADGNWSQVETIQMFNEHKKYEVKLPLQKTMHDEAVSFVFPTDAEGFEVTYRSLLKLGLARKVVTIEQLTELLEKLVADLKMGAR